MKRLHFEPSPWVATLCCVWTLSSCGGEGPDDPDNTLAAPAGVSASLVGGGVEVTWDAVAGASSYEVRRMGEDNWVPVPMGTSYTDAVPPFGEPEAVPELTASDATIREHVRIEVTTDVPDATRVEGVVYEVRALGGDATSQVTSAPPLTLESTLSAFIEREDPATGSWELVGTYTDGVIEDKQASGLGTPSNYRLVLERDADQVRFEGSADEGSRLAVVDVAGGRGFLCALYNNGTMRCWGENGDGQLGTGDFFLAGEDVGDDEPITDHGLVDVGFSVQSMCAGALHVCALSDQGEVKCWGDGVKGRLGQVNAENLGDDETPASFDSIDLGGKATEVGCGSGQSFARLENGDIMAWGDGGFVALGYGNDEIIGDDETPASVGPVPLGASAKRLHAGYLFQCAELEGPALRCWGTSIDGELGRGIEEPIGDDETPDSTEALNLPSELERLELGGLACMIDTSGDVYCWGRGQNGELGNGNTSNIGDDEGIDDLEPVELSARASDIAVGRSHVCTVLEDGQVSCWGSNERGALGYGSPESIGDDEVPGDINPLAFNEPVYRIFTSFRNTCALMASGALRCWGDNTYGQLGPENPEFVGDDEPVTDISPLPIY